MHVGCYASVSLQAKEPEYLDKGCMTPAQQYDGEKRNVPVLGQASSFVIPERGGREAELVTAERKREAVHCAQRWSRAAGGGSPSTVKARGVQGPDYIVLVLISLRRLCWSC